MSEVNDPIIQLIEEYLSGEMEDVRREELTAWLDKKEGNRVFRAVDTRWYMGTTVETMGKDRYRSCYPAF